MLRKHLMTALILWVMIAASVCWGQRYWDKTYGGIGDDRPNVMLPLPDGSVLIAAHTKSFGAGDGDIWLLKIGINGDTIWTKFYDGAGSDEPTAMLLQSDGSILILASKLTNSCFNVLLLKVNSIGDKLWAKTYDGLHAGRVTMMRSCPDSSTVIAWDTKSDASLLKINTAGEVLWAKAFGGTGEVQYLKSLLVQPDGSIVVLSHKYSLEQKNHSAWLIKTTPTGDTLWTKTINRNIDVVPETMLLNPDNTIMVAAMIQDLGIPNWKRRLNLIIVDTSGKVLSTKIYGESRENIPRAMIPRSDNSVLILGYTADFRSNPDDDVWLLKVNYRGDSIWSQTYDTQRSEFPLAFVSPSNGSFLIAGQIRPIHGGEWNTWILKVAADGKMLWNKTYSGNGFSQAIAYQPTGIVQIAAYAKSGSGDVRCIGLIDDRYARRDSLFAFKIPVTGDSLNHGYSCLVGPAGMSVSTGGTISWTPPTDLVYKENVTFLVTDDNGRKDTLNFNIWVNGFFTTSASTPFSKSSITARLIISKNPASPCITISLPPRTSNITIFDLNGRLVGSLRPQAGSDFVVWRKENSYGRKMNSGLYILKIEADRQTLFKSVHATW